MPYEKNGEYRSFFEWNNDGALKNFSKNKEITLEERSVKTFYDEKSIDKGAKRSLSRV